MQRQLIALRPLGLVFFFSLCSLLRVNADPVLGPWVPIFKGIDHARGTNVPAGGAFQNWQVANVVRVDLTDPDIRLFTTPRFTNYVAEYSETAGLAVSNFLTHYHVQVAVNCNNFHNPGRTDSPSYDTPFWSPFELDGLHISEGIVVSSQESRTDTATIMFATNNYPTIFHTNWPPADTTGVFTAITGLYTILANGVNIGSNYINDSAFVHQAQPRTVIGLSKDRRYLFLMTVDGRQANYSAGAKDWESAYWLMLAGAWDGINMDGGGSTTLVMQDTTGAPIELNSSSAALAIGRERTIGSHLGAYAKLLPGFINEVKSAVDDTSASITWTTLAPATSQVRYGPTLDLDSTAPLIPDLVTNHTVLLSGLTPASGYYFRVYSQAEGVEYASSNYFFLTTNYVTTNVVFGFTNSWTFFAGDVNDVTWAAKVYDDSSWTGPSPGLLWVDDRGPNPDIPETLSTQMPANPNADNFPYLTYYFRTRFHVTDADSVQTLQVMIYLDDGAVFYLNGAEVYRLRMPSAPTKISYNTLANVPPPCSGNAGCPDFFILSGPLLTNLVSGENLLAVEVHNYHPESPDITFGATLSSTHPMVRERPELRIIAQANSVILDWTGTGSKLQESHEPIGPWTDLPGPVVKGPLTNSITEQPCFFRLTPVQN